MVALTTGYVLLQCKLTICKDCIMFFLNLIPCKILTFLLCVLGNRFIVFFNIFRQSNHCIFKSIFHMKVTASCMYKYAVTA